MKKYALLLGVVLAACTVFAACDKMGGGAKPDLSQLGPSSVARTTMLPAGDNECPNGGIRIDTGLDANNDGILEPAEVKNTAHLCNDQKATKDPYEHSSLAAIESEPTGTIHCPAGGLKVRSGTDANSNGILDPGEDTYTEYICNGKPGESSPAGILMMAGRSVSSARGNDKIAAKSSTPEKVKTASGDSSKPAKKADADVKQPAPAAAPASSDGSAAPSKKASAKMKPAAATRAAPKGWTDIKLNSSIGKATYKIEGRYIVVHFQNTSSTSAARFKYTVTWKENESGKWTEESTVQGIGFQLKPLEELDREVRTSGEVKDVSVELDVSEYGGGN